MTAPVRKHPPEVRDRFRTVLVAVFHLLLFVSVLDYGSAGAETRVVVATGIFLLLILATVRPGLPENVRPVILAATILPLAAFCLVYLQTISPVSGVKEHAAWEQANLFSSAPRTAVASLTPADDRFALVSVALPFGFFLVAIMLFDTDRRASAALRRFSLAGGLIAVWSLAQFLLFPDTLVFGEKRFYLDSLTGFFVNRNTAATFFGIMLLTSVTLGWRRVQLLEPARLWSHFENGVEIPAVYRREIWGVFLYGLLIIAIFFALMLTRSRAGIGATFLGIVVLTVLMVFNASNGEKVNGFGAGAPKGLLRRLFVTLSAAVAIMLGFSIFARQALWRAEVSGMEDPRFCVMPAIWAAVQDNWPFGAGLASFAEAYNPYHAAGCGIYSVNTRAHNVYLEGTVTMGVAFPIFAGAFFLILSAIFIRGIYKRRRYRFAGNLGIASLVLVAAHSTLDFSLQIPGFAIMFATLTALISTLCLRPANGGRSLDQPGSMAPVKSRSRGRRSR